MAQYIERAQATDALIDETLLEGIELEEAVHAICSVPAADVASVRHGEWFVSIGKDGKPVGTICPICGFAWSEAIDSVKLEPCLSLIKTPYCPNCGALMDKDGDGT